MHVPPHNLLRREISVVLSVSSALNAEQDFDCQSSRKLCSFIVFKNEYLELKTVLTYRACVCVCVCAEFRGEPPLLQQGRESRPQQANRIHHQAAQLRSVDHPPPPPPLHLSALPASFCLCFENNRLNIKRWVFPSG